MAGGQPVGPRGMNPSTQPIHFGQALDTTFFHKKTEGEILMTKNQSNSTGSTVYLDRLIRIAPAEGFTVITDGTGDVIVEVSVDPNEGVWQAVSTISGGGIYSNSNANAWVRIGLADGASGVTVQIFRKYTAY